LARGVGDIKLVLNGNPCGKENYFNMDEEKFEQSKLVIRCGNRGT